jgi:hypothetical protein
MKRQKGMTFIGWVVILALVLSYIYIGIKVVPAYVEFFSVKKILATMAREPGFATMTPAEIRKSFVRRLAIDYVSAVSAQDLDIRKEDGENVVSVEYSQKIPLFYNVSVLLDFSASTAGSTAAKMVE